MNGFGVSRRWNDGEMDSSMNSDKRMDTEDQDDGMTARVTVLCTLTNCMDKISLAGTDEGQRWG